MKIFVIKAGELFDAEEAEEMWMEYPPVIGYDLLRYMDGKKMESILREIYDILPEAIDDKWEPVGKYLKVNKEQYAHHKFASLFIGGLQRTLTKIREIAKIMETWNSPPRDFKKTHIFRGHAPAVIFDAVVNALYEDDKITKESSSIITGFREEKAKRNEGFIIPHLLILGDTGTGKTLLAQWLHNHRFKRQQKGDKERESIDNLFQPINCGGIPENLIDSELFGGIKGAWTDLNRNLPGRIFCAYNGTLFLDEIGELPYKTQTTLLKFLDSCEYHPVGGHGEAIYVPLTVIAATNQHIEELVKKGKFRRDLYERFRFRILLPNLKQRMDHFEHLVDFVLQNPQINMENRKDDNDALIVKRISEQAMKKLKNYSWEGNFRELEQVLWKAVRSARNESRDIILHHDINYENY